MYIQGYLFIQALLSFSSSAQGRARCMFVTHFSVLLVLPSRDRSPCSVSHREESINQSVYMAVAVFEFVLGAFVFHQ